MLDRIGEKTGLKLDTSKQASTRDRTRIAQSLKGAEEAAPYGFFHFSFGDSAHGGSFRLCITGDEDVESVLFLGRTGDEDGGDEARFDASHAVD